MGNKSSAVRVEDPYANWKGDPAPQEVVDLFSSRSLIAADAMVKLLVDTPAMIKLARPLLTIIADYADTRLRIPHITESIDYKANPKTTSILCTLCSALLSL